MHLFPSPTIITGDERRNYALAGGLGFAAV
jgi:hypothetical protein